MLSGAHLWVSSAEQCHLISEKTFLSIHRACLFQTKSYQSLSCSACPAVESSDLNLPNSLISSSVNTVYLPSNTSLLPDHLLCHHSHRVLVCLNANEQFLPFWMCLSFLTACLLPAPVLNFDHQTSF